MAAVPPSVRRARALTNAHELGRNGESATDAILDDPGLLAAYEHGKNHPDEPAPNPEPEPAPGDNPHTPGGTGPRRRPQKSGSKGRQGRVRLGVRSSGSVGPFHGSVNVPLRVPGGTTGGLLLAVVLYPLGLSLVRYGAAGPGMWFRAKFLNKPTATTPAPPRGGGGGGTAPHYKSA